MFGKKRRYTKSLFTADQNLKRMKHLTLVALKKDFQNKEFSLPLTQVQFRLGLSTMKSVTDPDARWVGMELVAQWFAGLTAIMALLIEHEIEHKDGILGQICGAEAKFFKAFQNMSNKLEHALD